VHLLVLYEADLHDEAADELECDFMGLCDLRSVHEAEGVVDSFAGKPAVVSQEHMPTLSLEERPRARAS